MAQQVFEICKEKINLSKLTANNSSLCIDGTSSCFKTTILDKLEKKTNRNIYKVQNDSDYESTNINTHALAMMGYIDKGISDINKNKNPQFCDRSPINPLDWKLIWHILCLMNKNFGLKFNLDENLIDFEKLRLKFVDLIKEFKNDKIYFDKRNNLNILVLIDSDYKEVDERRFKRNHGSDQYRSNWGYYTLIQNIVYSNLYEDLFIDLNWFKMYSKCDIIDGLVLFFEHALNFLNGRENKDFIEKYNSIELQKSKLDLDYTTENLKSYMTKLNLKRKCCKIINTDFDETLIPTDIIYKELK